MLEMLVRSLMIFFSELLVQIEVKLEMERIGHVVIISVSGNRD